LKIKHYCGTEMVQHPEHKDWACPKCDPYYTIMHDERFKDEEN